MQQSQYDYEEDGTYCYPGTNGLRNKLNIHEKDYCLMQSVHISVKDDRIGRAPDKGKFRFGSS